MNTYERYDQIRTKLGLTNADASHGTGIADSTISAWKKGKYTPKNDKLQLIADFLGVSLDYLLTGKEPAYYTNPESAAIAQEIFENPDLRILFDASRDIRPEDMKLLVEMAQRLKATNPDG